MRNEAGQRLFEFCQENALVIGNTLFQQHKRRLYTWTSPDGRHRNQTDYILCSQRWRSSIQSTKTRPGADCGSDHELLIAKFRLKLKVGKIARPFRYDLNQIPYDYTVEMRNRFKGLDLIDRVSEELWTEVHDIQFVSKSYLPFSTLPSFVGISNHPLSGVFASIFISLGTILTLAVRVSLLICKLCNFSAKTLYTILKSHRRKATSL